MKDFDNPRAKWDGAGEIEDAWNYAQVINGGELADVQKIAGRTGGRIRSAALKDLVFDADISPEILNKLSHLASIGKLKLNGKIIRSRNLRSFVEALSGNDAVYALYFNEDDNEKSLVSRIDLSTSDVPLIDDSDGSDYKLYGVYASQDEADNDIV